MVKNENVFAFFLLSTITYLLLSIGYQGRNQDFSEGSEVMEEKP